MTRCRAVLAFAAFLFIIAGTPAAEPEVLKLPIRKIAEVTKFKTVTNPGAKEKKQVLTSEMAPVFTTYEVDPKKCAVVVCDMWDDHWCKSASKRCGELAKRTEPVLKAGQTHSIP
ncbi:hypothetical protein GobsT_01880 [Gemmata obscuriglobus]|uniref:hypothetical protein n=1 Tax=Gemmata obscuriglobus TaxID=114 RepID=UPI00016C473B|nr:hypothetical protein [Gemmata obscuriglobus]QEG25462.1 hypothetical protein GobsT_01880 [Gemmata obscuriglobus]VTR98651.1 Uncharacterized protein OS=Chthoniobacter flavus Ellin428 GN=CfE428DRAFT_5223 PE=4 SV=1 [Gemmata obscuriglobus UQM 2246]